MNKKKGKSVKCDLDYPKKLIVTRKVGSHAFNWMNSSQQFPFPWGYLSHGPPHTCCYHFTKLGPILDIKYAYFLFDFCFFPWEWGPRSDGHTFVPKLAFSLSIHACLSLVGNCFERAWNCVELSTLLQSWTHHTIYHMSLMFRGKCGDLLHFAFAIFITICA